MKPRKLNHKTIPANDPDRAYRFWRDVFDIPQTGDPSERHLRLDHQDLHFIEGKPPIQLELLVRDHQDALRQHLVNNFIPIISQQECYGNKVAFTIKDSEGNLITIEANR